MRFIASLLLLASPLVAGDTWPEFRGPTADGHAHARGLPLTWSDTDNVVWKTPIHGRAWSCPVIWEDRIWMTTATEDGKVLSAVCLDRESGRVLHDFKVFDLPQPPEIHKFNSYSSPTPAIEAGRVYLSWGSYGIACLDSGTADLLWSRRDLECDHYRGPGASPILFEDLLIQHYDGFDDQYVVALDKRTGDTVWRTPRPENFGTDNGDYKKAFATPIVIEVDGRRQLISPCSKGAFAYDPRTGTELWRIRYEGFSTACRPLYVHGLVFISTGFSKSEMIAVKPTGSGDVTDTHIVWRETKTMPSKPSPLIVGGRMFTIHDQGVATCLDARTGESVWQDRVGGNFSASPLFAEGRIYLFGEDGKTTVIAADGEYRVLAENQLPDGIMASPAVVGQSLFLRTATHLYRLEERAAAAAP